MDKNFPIISPHRRREAEREEELLRKEKLKWVSHHFYFVLMASVHPDTGDKLSDLEDIRYDILSLWSFHDVTIRLISR